MKNTYSRGFTLVEIGIVLVIVALLVGGILRGQELINSARARNIIDQKSSLQTAIIAFASRYKATAGDLTVAQANFIANAGTANRAIPSAGGGNGIVTMTADANNESVLVFQNLAATGFLSCTACTEVAGNAISNSTNSPTNVSSGFLQYGTVAPSALGVSWLDAAALPARNTLVTGSQIPSTILQEVDIKTDDGAPNTGLFRQSTTGGADTTANCAPPPVPAIAGVANRWANPENSNCAGAWLF